jgi:hypothetical protein
MSGQVPAAEGAEDGTRERLQVMMASLAPPYGIPTADYKDEMV